MDALTGGPGRRQPEMLRKLEELDRLDLTNLDPEQVLWPGGHSSRHDPRAWEPGRHRAVTTEPRSPRHGGIVGPRQRAVRARHLTAPLDHQEDGP